MDPTGEPTIDEPSRPGHEESAGGEFAAGTLLAGRYRIVSLLGRGGMGEVYRAEDLTLGQTVALKFLPAHWSDDPERLARFRQEVALARRVNHRNVCRVHDIGDSDGRTFLSMEFIAGEDLAALRRKMGRLTEEKALDIGRQLCAALAAVHEQGLLHRDLKPANVMLNKDGQVHLTDFGLASFAQKVTHSRAGTLLYMAPEQLERGEVTVQSDLYALGLVLYELFTGRYAFPPDVPLRARCQAAPGPPSDHAPGLNPAIDHIILRCLDPDPRKRPGSAQMVLSCLENRVVPSEVTGALTRRTATIGLVAILLLLGAILWLAPTTMLVGVVPLPYSAAHLRGKSQELLRDLGHSDRAADHLHSFEVVSAGPNKTLHYWYREADTPLVVFHAPTVANLFRFLDPVEGTIGPGMRQVRLDSQGYLVSFQTVLEGTMLPAATPPDWGELFALAELTYSQARPIEADGLPVPPVPCDAQRGWEVSKNGAPVRVEAATYRDQLVSFHVSPLPTTKPPPRRSVTLYYWFETLFGVLVLGCLGAALYWANDYLRRGLVDWARARRLALVFFVLELLAWLLCIHHVVDVAEIDILLVGVAKTGLLAGFLWLTYAAAEPLARREYPEMLATCNRLLSGEGRCPLVGRDILAGMLAGVSLRLFYLLLVAIPGWCGWPRPTPDGVPYGSWGLPLPALLGMGSAFGMFLRCISVSFSEGMFLGLTLYLILDRTSRDRRRAVILYCVLVSVIFGLATESVFGGLFRVPAVMIYCLLLTRLGVLAYAVALITAHLLQFPITTDQSAWYFPQTCLAVGGCLGLAAYGYWAARSRPG